MKFTIISVESRKGGVGKTTAALNLCDLLVERGYKTLLLDLDITGTGITAASQSQYWKNKINIIKQNRNEINILELFQKYFITGQDLPKFSLNSNQDSLFIKEDKTNIFYSEIYGNDDALICDPRILFNELHSFWIIEMISEICNNFIESFQENDRKVIVMDNSPGFIGLSKAIHNWLTDIGPIYGKFLTISSLDIQDLRSCLHGINNIKNNLQNKIESAKYFYTLNKMSDVKELTNNEQKVFFNAFTLNRKTPDKYEFYRSEDNLKNIAIKSYQSLIINKAPTIIKPKTFYYDINQILTKDEEDILTQFSDDKHDRIPKNVVYYDEVIQFQFFESLIKMTKEKIHAPLKSIFTKLKNETLDIKMNPSDDYRFLTMLSERYDRSLKNLAEKLNIYGFPNVTKQIEDRWYPNYPLVNLKKAYFQFNSETKFPNKTMSNDHVDIIRDLVGNIDHNFLSLNDLNDFRLSYGSLWVYLFQSSKVYKLNVELVYLISEIQRNRFKEGYSRDYRYHLANETLNNKEITNYFSKHEYIFFKRHENLITLSAFYNSFCHAQARLIDIQVDFSFLINLIRRITFNEGNEEIPLFPQICSIVDSVIIKKEETPGNANEKFIKIINEAKFMSDFRDVITKNIITKWNLV